MSIWNKVAVGLIIAVSLLFFYLAMRTLKTHQSWREAVRRLEQSVAQTRRDNQQLLDGNETGGEKQPGLRQYQTMVSDLTADRGRVWRKCTPKIVDPAKGVVQVATDQPEPHGIAVKSVLVAFDENEPSKGGRYLGQFVVDQVAEKQIVLSAVGLSPRELQRLTQSKGPWTLYEKMPTDRHDILAGLSPEELKAMLPGSTLADYAHDGQPATWEEVRKWGVDGTLVDENGKPLVDERGNPVPNAKGRFERRLRDYSMLFHDRYLERAVMSDWVDSMTRDIQSLQATSAENKRQIEATQRDIVGLKNELVAMRKQRDAVVAYYQTLKQKADQTQSEVERLLQANKAAASAYAKMQMEAARAIDARSRVAAQSGANVP